MQQHGPIATAATAKLVGTVLLDDCTVLANEFRKVGVCKFVKGFFAVHAGLDERASTHGRKWAQAAPATGAFDYLVVSIVAGSTRTASSAVIVAATAAGVVCVCAGSSCNALQRVG